MKTFKSIVQFQKEFDSDEKCRAYLEQQRWGGIPTCPFCGSINVCRLKTRKLFKCREKECRKQFTVLVGTIYQDTKISLQKWFTATYILAVHSKGISSLQLSKWLDVTQRTAWHLTHRIRQMLTDNEPELLDGIVEIDATFVGGSESNKHASKRKVRGGTQGKTMVLGAVQRKGKVRTKIIPQENIEEVTKTVESFVSTDSVMVTDEHHSFNKLNQTYDHRKVNHREKEYVRREDILVHTNNIEGFWNILKKQIDGIHHSVSPKHLQRYCNESAFRYNNREAFQDERFASALSNCEGTLQYKVLIGKE
jgi:transposase-like protein